MVGRGGSRTAPTWPLCPSDISPLDFVRIGRGNPAPWPPRSPSPIEGEGIEAKGARDWTEFDLGGVLVCYSGGAILVIGSRLLARFQASCSSLRRSVAHSMTRRSIRGGSRPAVTDGSVMSIWASNPAYSTWKWGGGCSRNRIRMIMPLNLQSSGTG